MLTGIKEKTLGILGAEEFGLGKIHLELFFLALIPPGNPGTLLEGQRGLGMTLLNEP